MPKSKNLSYVIAAFLLVVALMPLSLAVTINSISTETIFPGKESKIAIEIENNFDEDVKDLSVRLNLENLPFTPVGSSEQAINELEKDDEETFIFKIKASNDISPKDYQIPYILSYLIDNQQKTRTGTIGVTIKATPELAYTLTAENSILNQEGRLNLKIINKGFAEAKFLSVKIIPVGFRLLSESEVYIGTIESDDFETATFDVIFTTQNPILTAELEYKDLENSNIKKTINLPITVYTEQQALELGLIKKSNLPLYIGIVIALIIIWLVYRTIRRGIRRARRNKQMQ